LNLTNHDPAVGATLAATGGALPVWTDTLSVGVDVIDEDHQAFFRIAELLHVVLGDGELAQDSLIESVLNVLGEYVIGHFWREESALLRTGYAAFPDHATGHRAFGEELANIRLAYQKGDKSAAQILPKLVSNWIYKHILVEDVQYKGYLTNQTVDDRPLVYLAAEVIPPLSEEPGYPVSISSPSD